MTATILPASRSAAVSWITRSSGKRFTEPSANALISDYYPTDTRASAFSLQQIMGIVGAAVGIVCGLCLSLFVRRRRLWVRALPAGDDAGPGRTVVEVGGLARTDPEAFTAEFDELVERLRVKVPPRPPEQD